MNNAAGSFDVIVVGAGIIGASTALALAERGIKVCLLERGRVGQEASWAGGGMLTPLPPDHPVSEIRELLDESLRLYPATCAMLRDATGIDPEYWTCGLRYLQETGSERWFPEIAQVRNPRLMQALHQRLQQLGVPIKEQTPALGWQIARGRLMGVQTAQGLIACRYAVLAAGAWSTSLSATTPVRPVKGQMLLLRGEQGQLDHIRMDENAYLIPRRDGRILVGSTLEEAGFDKTITTSARTFLLKAAERLWPESSTLSIENQWAGLRPRPAQAMPYIGPLSEVDGLFLNTGHYRLGITLSLASAQQIAKSIACES